MSTFKTIAWNFLKKIVINTLVILAFSGLTQGRLQIDNPIYGLLGALLITILFALTRPVLLATAIITIYTLGIYPILVRTLLVYLVSYILSPHFELTSILVAVLLGLTIKVFNVIFKTEKKAIVIKTIIKK